LEALFLSLAKRNQHRLWHKIVNQDNVLRQHKPVQGVVETPLIAIKDAGNINNEILEGDKPNFLFWWLPRWG
jgi:hypothetical protein